ITSAAKKKITPKQKKVTVLSVVGPARPTPSSARAAGARTSIRAQIESSVAAVRFTGGNLAHLKASTRRMRRDVEPRGPAAGRGPGTDRVPADLLLRPPDHRSLAAELHVPAG